MRAKFYIVAAALIAFTLFSSFGHTKERINIIYPSISGLVLGLWVTKDAGIFDKHGLDANLIYIQSASAVMQAMLGGEASIVLAGGSPVVDLGLEGGDAVFIGGVGIVPAFYVMTVPEIRSVEDLKNKPVGVTRFGSSSDFTMRRVLKKHGLEPVRDVPIIQIGGGMQGMAAALLKRAIFAAPFSPPTNLDVEKGGGKLLVDMGKAGISFPHVSVITTRAYIKKNRAVVLAMLRAYSEGVKSMVSDKTLSLNVLRKYTRSKDSEVLEATYRFALDYIVRVPYPTRDGIVEILRESKNPKAKDAKPEQFIDDSLIRELEQSGLYR
ncbi:MAG TPA: ABC transporter substrate-binding protein [Candidatus Udaeobacter sp.]|jgi:ABC-type nitrate/sulfonate/bicarbonate transport system substrate-binding protein|nr:ABC transporter substrate-binding protein [Candidatus Udaeobacter sp.]